MAQKKAAPKRVQAPIDLTEYDAHLPAGAQDLNPADPVTETVFDAERRIKEAKRQMERLAKVPSFDIRIPATLVVAIAALETTQEAWKKSRRKARGATLDAVAKKARTFEEEVMRKGRYIFRHDPVMLDRFDTISVGDGIADLVADLGALQPIVKEHAAKFDAFRQTKEALAKLTGFLDTLTGGSDSVASLEAQHARNLAYWRVDYLSRELYDALVLVIEDQGIDVDRVVNLRSYKTRQRATQRRRQADEKRRSAGSV